MYVFVTVLTALVVALTASSMSLVGQVGEAQQERTRAWREREALHKNEQREVLDAIESAKEKGDNAAIAALYCYLEEVENERERKPFNGIFSP